MSENEKSRCEVAIACGWKMFPYIMPGKTMDYQLWCPPGAEVHISTAVELPPTKELLAAALAAKDGEVERLRRDNLQLESIVAQSAIRETQRVKRETAALRARIAELEARLNTSASAAGDREPQGR